MEDEAKYPFALLLEELDRLDKQAYVLRLIPLPDIVRVHAGEPYQVLDLACGPGRWTMDTASVFRQGHVYGLDIDERMIAFARERAKADQVENVSFQVGDAMKQFPFGDASLDYVHMRLVQSFVRRDHWGNLLAECWRVLRPGGVIQIVDAERPLCNKPIGTKFAAMAAQMGLRNNVGGSLDGQTFGICNMLAHYLAEAGFIFEDEQAYAVNYSAKRPAHKIWCENVAAVLEEFPKALTEQQRPEGEIEEAKRLVAQAIAEMDEPDFCAMIFFLSVIARKPG